MTLRLHQTIIILRFLLLNMSLRLLLFPGMVRCDIIGNCSIISFLRHDERGVLLYDRMVHLNRGVVGQIHADNLRSICLYCRIVRGVRMG